MSPQTPEMDPAALARRAAEEFAAGGYLAAQTAALVAIAGALTAKPVECTCPPWGNPNWPHRHGCPAAEGAT